MIYAGTVTEIEETVDNRLVYRVVGAGGHSFFPVFDSGLGGFQGVFSHTPVRKGVEVLICKLENRGFYIIGGLSDPRDLRQVKEEGTPSGADSDVNEVSVEDTHIRNTNSYLSLSPLNGAVIKGDNVRIQLSTGRLRISKEGNAENDILNASPFLDVLFSYIAELETKINTLEAVVKASEMPVIGYLTGAIATASAVPNPVLADQLRQELEDFTEGMTALKSTPTLTSSSSVKSDSENTVNSHIKVP